MHPLEILHDAQKLLDEGNVCQDDICTIPAIDSSCQEQPISTAFIKMVEAIGLYDNWLDAQLVVPNDDHHWAQHAVQSIIWREAGELRF